MKAYLIPLKLINEILDFFINIFFFFLLLFRLLLFHLDLFLFNLAQNLLSMFLFFLFVGSDRGEALLFDIWGGLPPD